MRTPTSMFGRNAAKIPMSNPTKPDVLDRMIARLEEANARSYKEPLRADERKLSHDDGHQSPDQQTASNQRSSRVRPGLVAVIGLLLATSAYLTTFVWKPPYLDTVKLTIVRWVNASEQQSLSQTPPHDGAVPVPLVPPEIEYRFQKIADELGDLQQQIERLKVSQDQVGRSGAEDAARSKIDREQMVRDNANIVDQLKVTQEQLKATQAQLAEIVLSGPTNSGRKFSRRKHPSALSLSRRARARSSVR